MSKARQPNPPAQPSWSLQAFLFHPTDIAPLVYFRVLGVGLITLTIIGQLATNFRLEYLQGEVHFSYVLFPWVKPWPPVGMYLHMSLNIVCAVMVTLGLYYRLATVLMFLGTSWLLLMEKTVYINHVYLYCLIAFLLIFIPAHRAYSLDAKRRPEIVTACVPAWTVYLLVLQISVVYFFAGVAKINPDWLQAKPMNLWLTARAFYPLIGGLLSTSATHYVLSYGGMIFDLLIVPGMLWRTSRPYAFGVAIAFHLTNIILFGVGTFPWFAIVMTGLFFPARAFRKFPVIRQHLLAYRAVDFMTVIPKGRRLLVTCGVVVYAVIQFVMPLRQFIYPGYASWTEEGHYFSWRMMLRQKERGRVQALVKDPLTEKSWQVNPSTLVTKKQYRKLAGNPDMLLDFAQQLAARYRQQGYPAVEVRIVSFVGLNGRPMQPIVDTTTDLAAQQRSLTRYDWIMPLKE